MHYIIERHGTPEIFNADQGSDFTADAYAKILIDNEINISMDGRGRALDNIIVERLWRSVKYEYIYLCRPETGIALCVGFSDYFER